MTLKAYTVIHHTGTAPGSGKFITGYHLVLDYHLGRVRIYTPHAPDADIAVEDETHPPLYAVGLVGNYNKYDVPLPLLNALIHVLRLKTQRKEIPAQIYTHSGLHQAMKTHQTPACPGKYLAEKLPDIRAQVLQKV